jgi:hypothetical protein
MSRERATSLYGRSGHKPHSRPGGRAYRDLSRARYPHGSRKTRFIFPSRAKANGIVLSQQESALRPPPSVSW